MGMSGEQGSKWRRFSRWLNIVALIALLVGAVAPAGASAALPVGRPAGETAALARPASADATSLITNGDFSAGLTGWSSSGSVSIDPGASEYWLVFNGGNNPTGGQLWQQVNTEAGKPYALTYALMQYTGGWPSPGFASQAFVEVIDVGTGQVLASATSVAQYQWPEGFALPFVAQGPATIRFTDMSEGTSGQDLYMDNVAVTLANQPPSAVDDSYTASYQTALVIDAPGVLGNDTDPDSDPLTAVKATDPAHGSVTLNADGSFTYTPAAGYTGADSFTYHANDGTVDSNDATVSITVGAPACATQPANLVSWWRAEGDAKDALDGNHGAPQNGATYAAGEVGQAFSLDGVNQHISVPSSANIEMRNNLTVMAWFKVNSLGDGAHAKLFTKRAAASAHYGPYEVDLFNDGGSISVQSQYSMDGVTWNWLPALQPIAAGEWHHVAFVVDDSNLHSFYLDGQPQGSTQLSAPLMAHAGVPLLFGADDQNHFPLDGLMDEVQIASRALSAAEIQGVFDAGISGVCAPTNTAPTAANDSYEIAFETDLIVPAAGVLANDTDPDSDPLTAVKVADPAHGTVTLNADGSFNYRATTGYAGPDSFTYQANDGAHPSNVATVSISVLPSVGDAGLLGYWKMDDGAGTTALDSSDYTRNGTVSGGATWSTTVAPITYYSNPGSISMSGSTGLVTIPNSDINKLTNNFSVMAWVNPSSVSVYQRVIGTARTKSANGWSFGLVNNKVLFTTHGKKDYSSVATGMTTGKWYHIAAVMDGSNAVTFYLDGVPVGTVTGSAPATADTDDVLQIGAITASGGTALAEVFNGLIDDAQVYNRALSAAEVANMAGVSPCSETVFRARTMLAEASSSKVLTLDGACVYTLSTVGDAWSGGNGVYLSYVTTIDGNGATIERSPTAPQMRVMTLGASAVTVNNLTIRGGNVLGNGGGVFSWSNLTLNNVRFENNTTNHPAGATYVQTGGALYAAANLTVDRSAFINNVSDGLGGAIYFKGTTGVIKNSVFADSISGSPGAAINAANAAGSLTLLNNTFSDQYRNAREALLFNGAGTVKNNIFDNFTIGMTASGSSAAVTEDYNLFAGADLPTQALSGGVITAGGHDRNAGSPRFVNAANRDYRLQGNSPAIDLGVDAGVPTDAAGNPRPATTGTAIDIGAYEYQGVGVPSISIAKVGPPYAAATGQSQFVITVINEGVDPINDLRIVDPLPVGATYVAGSASSGGTLNGGSLVWDLAPLGPNAKARVWYQVTATQDLISSGYTVSSIANPAITATGADFTTVYDANYTALGYSPFPDGYSYANWGTPVFDTDITVDDMVSIYGPAVCKTQNPCVLTAAAEAQRKTLSVTSSGGHCGGMAMSSLYIYDRPDVEPSLYQPGAINTFDLTWANARHNVVYFHSTQTASPADTSGLSGYSIATGAANVVNALLTNFANPNADNRYTLWFFKPDWSSGHAVVPFAIKKVDNDHYWIYIYDVNYPNNYDRYFEITMSANSWIYNMAAANPSVPPSPWAGDNTQPTTIQLKSLRWAERFPKQCTTACAPYTFSKLGPANAATGVATNPTLSWEAAESATEYQYCYDTTNDNACSAWYINGTSTSKALSGLAPNTTYYWHARAKNSYGYTYSNGSSTAFWSFTTGTSATAFAPTLAALRPEAAPSPTYEFKLEGEGYLMITRSDGKRAGVEPATGAFIAEIPGAEQALDPNGLLNTPNPIRIPHEAGMTYTLRISDRPNAYGNASATADVNISGAGYMTRLTGLKIDSPTDPTSGAGANDVLGVTFDPEKHTVSFQSSSLDSDTPSLGMAISQQGMPDFTFEISGASMPPGKEISVALDPETGKLTVTNDNPANDSYTYSVERINLDGSKTSYTGAASDGTGQGASFDLGPSWTGGAPAMTQVNTALKLETTTPEFCIADNATIDLNMTNVLGLYGYQIDVTYDQNKVSATAAFDNGWFDTTNNASVPGGYNAACGWSGVCKFGATRVAPATPLTGSGRLGTITLTGLTPGAFNLTISASLLSDIDGTPITHEVVNLPLTVCGLSTISGKISMQGRATPINAGAITLTDPTGTYGPYTADFSAADGTWTITGVRAAGSGTVYTLKADHGLYLFNQKDITVQRSTSYADQNTRLWGGDANNDEKVSIGDLSCIGGAFGSWQQCGTDGGSDINADGTTNILDLSIAGGNYGKQSPQGW